MSTLGTNNIAFIDLPSILPFNYSFIYTSLQFSQQELIHNVLRELYPVDVMLKLTLAQIIIYVTFCPTNALDLLAYPLS